MKNLNKKFVIIVFIMVFAYFVYKDNRALSDHYVIWRNPPTTTVVELADITGMSDLSRRIFFASMPNIADAEALNANCAGIETAMIILGCYSRGRIHVFNVTDESIKVIKYVTAAHEMLHAAYARLSNSERRMIDRLLEEAYHYAGKNDELRDIMAEYIRMKPEQFHNELHSILGTEYAGLYPELESYYARYFTDRRKIVAMAVQYREVFKNIESEQTRIKTRLDRLTAEIEADISLLDTLLSWLNSDIETFNARTYYSRSELVAEMEILVEREREINMLRTQIQANIDQHGMWVKEFNSLGGRIDQLNYQLDSKLQTGVSVIKGAKTP